MNKYIFVRLDEKLYNQFDKFCKEHNIAKASFIRNCIKVYSNDTCAAFIIKREEIYKKKLMYQVHCYGNNLNQIAHKLNIAIKSDRLSASDLIDLKTAINSINEIYNRSVELEKYIHDRLQ